MLSNRFEDAALVFVHGVDRAHRDPRLGGDLLDSRDAIALFEKQGTRRLHDELLRRERLALAMRE